ncbi:peptidylprolyl isomerase [Aestuariibaculum sediminum]|uniref:peptidylprolyl isomerase n=1 Tax=Aestuariibaculum sediminum TaxID=2770637 RepID=UPI001CB6C0A1|nr:peptidylprolyl isomerase [Aestuariibaculum sediminum]
MVFICVSCKKETYAEIKTPKGNIIVKLYTERAPITCANFLKLIENKMLQNGQFYRVVRMDNQPDNDIKIEVIQGGIDNDDLDYPPIMHESTNDTGVLHKDGTISMARLEPGSATTEFFICIGDQPELDFGGMRNPDGQGFAAFGKVIKGMEIVREIQKMKQQNQMLINPVPFSIKAEVKKVFAKFN